MSFMWPFMLWLLILVPLIVAFYGVLQRRQRRVNATFSGMGLLQGAGGQMPVIRRHIPMVFFLIGLTILIVALARPQTIVSLPKEQGTIILAFDVSGSMAAEDLKPTRMDAAKAAAKDFIQRQPLSVQVGVVAFSDAAFSMQTPTNDKDAILASIERLAPQKGTSVGNGILNALKAIAVSNGQAGGPLTYSNLTPSPTPTPTPLPRGQYTNGVIILLTDGENNESPDPLGAAQTAADRGVRIYTVGLGSAAGSDLHINGFIIHTQLDEATLQQISQITGGTYYNAQNAQDLNKIFDKNLNTQLVIKPEETEVTSFFAGASILVLLLGGTFSLLWFSRLP